MAVEHVLRVSRLDALQLDEELSSIMQQQLLGILRGVPFSSLLSRITPELKALIRIYVWHWSVWKRGATFGQLMMNMRYSQPGHGRIEMTSKMKWFLFVSSVITGWAKDRVHLVASYLTSLSPNQVEKGLSFFMALVHLASLCNFCIFLIKGQYPSLTERFASLDMIPTKRQTLPNLQNDFLNREILWHGFSEFLFFILPHLNLFAVRNWLRRLSSALRSRFNLNNQESYLLDTGVCSYCEELPVTPQRALCGHVYCYYCVAANVKADSNYPCCLCGKPVNPFEPLT